MPLSVSSGHEPGFQLQPALITGVTFTNTLSEMRSLTNTIVNNGSGVALGDVDGDGRCDIYFCRLEGPNALYRNLGSWKFEEIAASAGVACDGQFSTGAVLADVDGDGDLDLLVNAIGRGTRLFLNDGRGKFTESNEAGLVKLFGSTSLALADIDGDGDLDLYVANYRTTTILDQPQTRFSVAIVNGKPTVTRVNGVPVGSSELTNRFVIDSTGVPREAGEADILYLNDGHGRFSPIPWATSFTDESGKPITIPYDWGLSVAFRDINGDGSPDIYVCNDTDSPDRIWINDGHGKFHALSSRAVRHTSLSSMGVDFADLNRDGMDDFLVADMSAHRHEDRMTQLEKSMLPTSVPGQFDDRAQYPHNTLFVNRGDGTFAEIAYAAGVQSTDWSWTPLFLDVDLDGWEDLLMATGFHRNVLDSDAAAAIQRRKANRQLSAAEELQLRSLYPTWESPNLAFRNMGGSRFEEVSGLWGFAEKGVSQGMAEGDLDGDGDLDVVLNNLNGAASLLRNEGSAPRLAVRLKGVSPNTQGIGARIEVRGGPVTQTQEMISGGRYLSGGQAERVFATGTATNLSVEVHWRSGRRSVLTGLAPNMLYEVDEAAAEPARAREPQPEPLPVFEDQSARLGHRHQEEPFDDFARQPLLPRRLSQAGPGVAWADLNGDGVEDLLIGAGRGGRLGVFGGTGQGGFRAITDPQWSTPAVDDLGGIVVYSPEAGVSRVLVGQSHYESAQTNRNGILSYEVFFGQGQAGPPVPAEGLSPGPVALGDLEGDGDVDLFVSGGVQPGRYPLANPSVVYRQEGGQWQRDEANSRVVASAGLVNGAVWCDLDGDALPELVLGCEWGPVRVYANRHGHLEEATAAWGLADARGQWTGVSAGDLDGDGRLDLVVGNWGSNTPYQEFLKEELRMYHGDVDGNGTWEVIEGQWDAGLGKVVPRRDWRTVGRAVPEVQSRFESYRAYGQASVEEIYGKTALGRLSELRINTLESTVLLNRGGKFERHALPPEAQWAPVFGVCVGDYDGDGKEDVFVSQNFFGTDADTGRYDAGRGLWLRGDGKGGLTAVPGQQSGVVLYGEQRGAALGDYDGDGRVDLAVGQSGAPTGLFHNRGAKPGLRVRLVGPPGNASGLGAVVRWGAGPARLISGGGGYWSQDSATVVLAAPPEPSAPLTVRWPGGHTTTTTPVPTSAKEVRLSFTDQLELIR